MPSAETMKQSQSKEELEVFLDNPSTKELVAYGKDANWTFVRGKAVTRMSSTNARISVVMVDKNNPKTFYEVELNRVTGGYIKEAGKPPVAMWDIHATKAVKE